jgi:hypothetical protein
MEDEKANTPESIPAGQQQNSNGTGEEQQNAGVATPEQIAAQPVPTKVKLREIELDDASFIDTKKYGSDPTEAVIKQAKSYKSAVKEMLNATQKRGELERENEVLKNQLSQVQQPQYNAPQYSQYGNAISEQVTQQVQNLYGTDVSVGSVLAQRDIVKSTIMEAIEPLYRTMAQNEISKQVEDIRETDATFEIPEVQNTFVNLINKLSYNEQMKRDTVKKCLNEAKGINAQLIISKGIEKGIQEYTNKARPVSSTPPVKPNSQVQTPEPEEDMFDKTTTTNLNSWGMDSNEIKSNVVKSKNGGKK